MIRNYLVIALRNFIKHRAFSAINILGLGIGIACSILILLWISNEVSYNRFNVKVDRIFRLVQTQHYVSGPLTTTCMPGPIARDLRNEIPEIANSFMYYVAAGIVSHQDKFFKEDIRLADPALWQMFTFHFLEGDPAHVFDDLNSVVITENFAGKYFGDEEPLGKLLKINNEHSFKVTGVISEIPENSTFRFDLCVPFDNLNQMGFNTERYGWNSYFSYVELVPGADYKRVNEKIEDFLMVKTSNPDADPDERADARIELFLFPLKDIYLHAVTGQGGNIKYVYIFSMIAVFILIIACINFMNLTTAKAVRRSREIGLRKVAGATRKQIIFQFLGESMLITIVAFVLSVVLVFIFLPGFNQLTGKQISFDFSNAGLILGLSGIVFFVGLLSGSYPSFYLSKFGPVDVLKNGRAKGKGNTQFRKILVVFQFTLSVAMIICTLVVYRQLNYIDRKDMGMNREDVIYAEMRGKTTESYRELKSAFMQNPSVMSVTRASGLPFQIGSNGGSFNWEEKESTEKVLIGFGFGDYGYVETFGMEMVEGRWFEEGYAMDTSASIVINETAAKVMGMEDPLGKWISWGNQKYSIIGVIKDFHFQPMTEKIGPLVFLYSEDWLNTLFVKFREENTEQAVSHLTRAWERINPGFPFEYKFLEASYDELYVEEDRLLTIFKYFSFLTILISSLGLFGLAAYMTEIRTKEMGIRKVLGAGDHQILTALAADFIKWIIIANAIAIPLTYYIMGQWLNGYAYHTRLSPWIFILAALISIVIALVTISFQTIKAAIKNPVFALKYE